MPLIEDLGSGAMVNTADYGVGREPTPSEVLRRGVGLICFSGDKLLGGPQAGVIAGQRRWVAALKREPFFRALRCDKLILGALQATAEAYLPAPVTKPGDHPASAPTALGTQIPVLGMLEASEGTLRARAQALQAALVGLPLTTTIGVGQGQVGGGTLPKAALPSVALDLRLEGMKPTEFVARLRAGSPPVIAFSSRGRVRIDLRTVFPSQDTRLAAAIRAAADKGPSVHPSTVQ